MDETKRDDRVSVYEIGYLLAGLPEEKVEAEASTVKDIITKNGGTIIAEESPRNEKLAYTMRKKMVSGSYDKYDEAHFGWVKFEATSGKVDAIKKAVEVVPTVLRMLVTTTVRENTYLGKHASQIAATFKKGGATEGEVAVVKKETVEAPATIEEMDKSIDEMVKEA